MQFLQHFVFNLPIPREGLVKQQPLQASAVPAKITLQLKKFKKLTVQAALPSTLEPPAFLL